MYARGVFACLTNEDLGELTQLHRLALLVDESKRTRVYTSSTEKGMHV